MFTRAIMLATGLLLAAGGASAQMGGMPRQGSGGMHGSMGRGMMMQGMTGGGTMECGGPMGTMGPGRMSGGMMGSGIRGAMGQGMQMGTMAAGRLSPSTILRMGRTLDLTDPQVTQLRQIRAKLAATRTERLRAAATARRSATVELQKETPDLDAYRKALTEATQSMVEARVAMAQASLDARNVLTPEQRGKLQTGMSVLRDMMGGGMGGGMMEGPGGMMRGGPGTMRGRPGTPPSGPPSF